MFERFREKLNLNYSRRHCLDAAVNKFEKKILSKNKSQATVKETIRTEANQKHLEKMKE